MTTFRGLRAIACAAIALLVAPVANACGPAAGYGYGRYYNSYQYAAPVNYGYQQQYQQYQAVAYVPVAAAIYVNPYVPTVTAQLQAVAVAPVAAVPVAPVAAVPVAPAVAAPVAPAAAQPVQPPAAQPAPRTPPPAVEQPQGKQTSMKDFVITASLPAKEVEQEEIIEASAEDVIEEKTTDEGVVVRVGGFRRPAAAAGVQFQGYSAAAFSSTSYGVGASFRQPAFRAPVFRQQRAFYAPQQQFFAQKQAFVAAYPAPAPVFRQPRIYAPAPVFAAPFVRQRAFYAPPVRQLPVPDCYPVPVQLPAPGYAPCAGAGLGGCGGGGVGAAFSFQYGY